MIPKVPVRYLNYNFEAFDKIMLDIKANPTTSKMNELKQELNRFFKDSRCKEVIYTKNTDKMFFGMAVMPVIKDDRVYEIIQDEEPIRIDDYYLELDSKLFSPILGLSAKELTAVLLHEVGHMVNDTTPVDKFRKNLDTYLVQNKEHIKISDSVHYKEILAFGIKDSLRKITSIFERKDDEIIADQFAIACGYAEPLESAFEKIVSKSYNINKDVDNKFIVMAWVLRLYVDVKLRRIAAIKTMQRGKALSGSALEKREMDNMIRRLRRIDDDSLLEASVFDAVANKYNAVTRKLKAKGIRSYEDDLYDYNLRVKNVTTEDQALSILHSINVRINIIEDYLDTEELSEAEVKRWYSLLQRFQKLREVLSNKHVYGSDYSRIYITYPEIVDNR